VEIIKRNPKELIKADYNPRKISDKDFKQLKKSLETFQCVEPIVVNQFEGRENVIVGGHQRLKAMESLGWSEVPTIEVYLDLDEEKELNVRLNKNTGEFDFELLTDLFDTDKLEEIGFDLDELPEITEDLTEPLTDPDEAPEPPKEPKTRLGDIYELGNHRLMCGDSTSIDAVEKLMNGEKADMLFTDPPYNVAFNGRSGKHEVIKNDNLKEDEFSDFIDGFFSIVYALAIPQMYIWCNWKFFAILQKNIEYKSCIVWAKNVFGMGNNYRHQHEFCLFSGEIDKEIKNESDLWQIAKDSNYVHPTQKPTELSKRALGNHKNAKIILDLFGGSGSTLIGCEETGRKARLMELDPKYCDVIVERWENFTGKKAKLISNGGE